LCGGLSRDEYRKGYATLEMRKTVMKTMEESHMQELERLISLYTANLSSAVKGKRRTQDKNPSPILQSH
jgi:hypothetical protein